MDELYLEYVRARDFTWYVHDGLQPIAADELYLHPTYRAAIVAEHKAYRRYVDAIDMRLERVDVHSVSSTQL